MPTSGGRFFGIVRSRTQATKFVCYDLKVCDDGILMQHNYHNSGYYPSSCLLFKTQRFGDWILSEPLSGIYSVGPNGKSWPLSLERRVLNKKEDDG
jgi:hypothetical protein